MSTLPPLGLPPDIAKIAEPLLLGQLLHWGLFGVLSVQVYIYHLAFSNDPLQRKVLVYGVYAVEIVQTILYSKIAYTEFAAGFGNYEALNKIGLFWFAVPFLSNTVAFTVQVFYAYKIKSLARSNLIPMVVVLFAFLQLGPGIAQGVIAHRVVNFSNFLVRKSLILDGIWNGSSALCDIVIAASTTYYLSRQKTAWKSTQRKIQKLTRLIIETGTLTAAIAIVNLILFMLPGHPTYYQSPSAILGILYATTMMVVINSRIVMSHHDSASDEPLSSMTNSRESRRPPFSALSGGISVTHEQWTVPALDVYNMHTLPKGLEANFDNVHTT